MGQDDCQVDNTMNELLKEVDKKIPSPPLGQQTYVTHLSFMDGLTFTTMLQTEVAALIEEAVIKGMNAAQRRDEKFAINEPGHNIPNTDANVNRLINITFDPNITQNEKINKLISEMMDPYNVDVIVTGHYIDQAKNPLITIRPLVIVKNNKRIVTKNLQFKKGEVICADPINIDKKILCKGAHDEIAQAVKELLEQI